MSSAQYRIVCVDDEPDILHVLRRVLAPLGDVAIAVDAETALECIASHAPVALVIADLAMTC